MNHSLTRLYPLPSEQVALKGLYLNEKLNEPGEPFVFSNYVTSLDGRIAVPRLDDKGMQVPANTANPRDWRLFQELQAQADIVITTGRYLREYAEGKGQENLKVYEQPEFADLAAWRRESGMKPYPDIAVLSGSLDFPIPDVLKDSERAIYALTTENADPQRKAALAGSVSEVLELGKDTVDGQALVKQLGGRGYKTIFLSAGPKAFHLLLAAKVVDRLYLTYAHRILGGQPFASIVEGALLSPATDLRLRSLYLDAQGLDGLGQIFAAYEVV